MDAIIRFLQDTGFYLFSQDGNWRCLIMLGIACVLLYLGIVKKFEPLLLVPIAFGMLLTNLPGANLYHTELFADCLSNLSIDTYNLVTFIVFIWRESCVCTHYKSTFCCCCLFAFC